MAQAFDKSAFWRVGASIDAATDAMEAVESGELPGSPDCDTLARAAAALLDGISDDLETLCLALEAAAEGE